MFATMHIYTHTLLRCGNLNNVGQIEIDGLDRRILGHDHLHQSSGPASDVHKAFHTLKTFVFFKNLPHYNRRMFRHSPVEHLVHSCILSRVLELAYSVRPFKRNSSFYNRIFQMVPKYLTNIKRQVLSDKKKFTTNLREL